MSFIHATRRDVLKALGLAASLAQGSSVRSSFGRASSTAPIPLNPLGRTQLMVPRICFGAAALSDHNANLLGEAFARGITMVDTAQGYGHGNSESIVGGVARGFSRENFIVQTKVAGIGRVNHLSDVEVENLMTRSVEDSLRRLQMDYIDILLYPQGAHYAEDVDFPQLRRAVEKLKQSGKIRFFGCSTHKEFIAPTEAAIDSGWHDVVMTSMSMGTLDAPLLEVMAKEIYLLNAQSSASQPQRRVPKSVPVDMRPLMAKASAAGIGLIGMKGAAYIMELPRVVEAMRVRFPEASAKFSSHQLCYRWLYEQPYCHSVCVGITNMLHLEQALALTTMHLT